MKDDGVMALPLFLDRPFRRFLKNLPTSQRSLKQLRLLLLLPLLLIFFCYPRNTLSLTRPLTRTLTPGTTTITPCSRLPIRNLTVPQRLNLLAALADTQNLLIHLSCNTTAVFPPASDRVLYTTAKSLLVPRDSFISADGFDERLTTPHVLPLSIRLSKSLRYVQLSNPSAESTVLIHLPLSEWKKSDASVYSITSQTPLSLSLTTAPSLFQHDESLLAEARKRALHDVHHLPWILLHRLPEHTLHPLITALDTGKKLMIVHVAHGLGNRLRALGSALAFAKATNRIPMLAWPADAHCTVTFSQLFEEDIVVVDDLPGYPFKQDRFYDIAWRRWDLYSYMAEEGVKDERIVDGEKHIYYRGAYVMRAPQTTWDTANIELRALRPVERIKGKVDEISERLGKSIGVHVRHLSTDKDIGGVDPVGEYGDFDTRVIGFFRASCSPKVFIEELRKVKAETGLKEVFVAADDARWRYEIAGSIDGVWGMTGCEGRCEMDALVDLLALARCPTVLGSFWSSFSEAIQRFSGHKIRLAGVDFGEGVKGFGGDVEEYVKEIVEKRRAAVK